LDQTTAVVVVDVKLCKYSSLTCTYTNKIAERYRNIIIQGHLSFHQFDAVLYSSPEPSELSQWLCSDESTIVVVIIIIIIIIIIRAKTRLAIVGMLLGHS